MDKIPHVIPYHGSKRKLAQKILRHISFQNIDTFYEPFAGSAALTIAAASNNLAKRYVIGDKLDALAKLWEMIILDPEKLINEYTNYWNEQQDNPKGYYIKIRDKYNTMQTPSALLYLTARCVNNAVRFNLLGEFNQSPDNRRLGMRPENLKKQVLATSKLLIRKTTIVSGDFKETIKNAGKNDLIYFDPPWAGFNKNPRYAYLLDINSLIMELKRLNKEEIPFLLSYDGSCGDRSYIQELPDYLSLEKVSLVAGRSSQSTLLGRNEVTIESLYLSHALIAK